MTTTDTQNTTATQHHLWTVARHWRDLTEALAARQNTWPPAMGISVLSNRHQSDEEAEAATWRAEALRALERSPDQPGWSAAPLRLDVLDTMRTVEAGLVELADQIAALIQHAPITPAPPRGFRPADRKARARWERDDARRDLLALKESKDPRRWRIAGTAEQRTADRAALWLLAQVQGVRGPWQALPDTELARIVAVAHSCALLVEHALDVGDERVRLAVLCPICHGLLDMHGGAGASPVVRCTSCGQTWTQHDQRPWRGTDAVTKLPSFVEEEGS